MKKNILVVEDAKDYQVIIGAALKADYTFKFASSGAEALELVKHEKFDLLIIDVVLPDMNGLQICNYIKNQKGTADIPVILVTSKDTTEDKVKGFDTGADDYLTKPFHFNELIARVKARLRSSKNTENDEIFIPDLKIDLKKQNVWIISQDRSLDLTRVEFKLLVCFAQRVDHVLTRQTILDLVWPQNLNISERTVDTHISNLRKKLAGINLNINAVHGNGYRLSIIKTAA